MMQAPCLVQLALESQLSKQLAGAAEDLCKRYRTDRLDTLTPTIVCQAAEAAEDVHRLVGAAAGQLKALLSGSAAMRNAGAPLAAALAAGLESLAGIGGYAQVRSRDTIVLSLVDIQPAVCRCAPEHRGVGCTVLCARVEGGAALCMRTATPLNPKP